MLVEMQFLAARHDPQLVHCIERCVQHTLGRLAARVRHVRVCLQDVNGPRGGIDKRCRMCVHLVPSGAVVVETVGQAFEQAVSVAAERVIRRVRGLLERRQDRHRRRRPGDQAAWTD